MTQIRTLYATEPPFPATDQHPAAVRYAINVGGMKFADCVGGPPSQAELDGVLGLDATGVAAAARVAADTADLAVCAQDPQVTAFLNMSPAELDAWVATNITAAGITLAQLKTNSGIAITVLGKLALNAARGRKLRNGS